MQKEIFEKILTSLQSKISRPGSFIQFNDTSYIPIPFSQTNFKEIKDPTSSPHVAWIDGGNASIISASNFSLQAIKIAYCTTKGKKRLKTNVVQCFALITSKSEGGSIGFTVSFYGLPIPPISFDSFDRTLATGSMRIDIESIASPIRRMLELDTAKNLTQHATIIILDGDLKATVTGELQQLDELYQNAGKNKATIAAIAKTNNLLTETGNAAIPIIKSMEPKYTPWYYHPLAEIRNEHHKADIAIIKAHPKAKHCFKLERHAASGHSWAELASIMKQQSQDAVFLGYPYGLLEADRAARVTNKEQEYFKTMVMAKLGNQQEHLEQFLATKNTHSILDNIQF